MSMLPLLLCLLVSLTSVLGAPEAFFRPPAGWREKRPGEVLRSRTVHPQLFDKGPVNVTAHQVLYRTSGTAPSEASHTVTTVLVPEQPLKDQLVLFAPEEDSVSATCAPSAMVASPWEGVSEFVADSLTELLKRGYTVTMPDFEGPNSAFGAGRLGGHMSLDGVRATLAAGVAPLSKQSKVVGYGYSGGSQAVGWAAVLHRRYAPELNVAGWAMGGSIVDLGALMHYQDGGAYAGFALANVAGLSNAYPQIARSLQHRKTAEAEELFQYVSKHCKSSIKSRLEYTDIQSDKYFRNGSILFYEAPFVRVHREQVMGAAPHETPAAPVLMHHALRDQIVPYGPAKRAAERWAAWGANVTFNTNPDPGVTHTIEKTKSFPEVLSFVGDRFKGVPFPRVCRGAPLRSEHRHAKPWSAQSRSSRKQRPSFGRSVGGAPSEGPQERRPHST